MYKDHLGNIFNTKKDMCKYWGISRSAYDYRINKGYSLEETLTLSLKYIKCKDHLGNEFNTKKDMCKYWGINRTNYDDRIKSGWSVEEALTTPKFSFKKCKDHLGNEFKSIKDMCDHWKIQIATYHDRISKGYSLEEVLTTPKFSFKKYKDHLGNEFKSISSMCRYWNVPNSTYTRRINEGWTIEKALTYTNIILITDPITNKQLNLKQLSEIYKINQNTLSCMYYKNHPIVRIIGVSFIINSSYMNINKTKYNLTVARRTEKGKDVFECYIDNGDGTSTFKIMTYDMIDQYCLEQYKKLHNIA